MTQHSHKGAKEQKSKRATTTSRYKRLPNYLRYTYQSLASTRDLLNRSLERMEASGGVNSVRYRGRQVFGHVG